MNPPQAPELLHCRDKLTSQAGLTNVLGALYASVLFFAIINALVVQPVINAERAVSYRERAAGMYSFAPWTLALVIFSAPCLLLVLPGSVQTDRHMDRQTDYVDRRQILRKHSCKQQNLRECLSVYVCLCACLSGCLLLNLYVRCVMFVSVSVFCLFSVSASVCLSAHLPSNCLSVSVCVYLGCFAYLGLKSFILCVTSVH